MFVISIEYKVPLSEVEPHLEAHRHYLDVYYGKNIFLASGAKVPRTGGIIIATAENLAQLEAIVAQDPFFMADVADYEITEFAPTKTCEALAFTRVE